jgi:hypothetical protein
METRQDVHKALRLVIQQAQRRLTQGIKLSLYYRESTEHNDGGLIALSKPLTNKQYHLVSEISGFKTVDQNFNTLAPMLESAPILNVANEKKKIPNKRFNWDGVKFCLRPGESLSHHKSGPTDEGYWFKGFTLECAKDGSEVTCSVCSGGRDCDGSVENYVELVLVNDEWVRESHRVRDHFAEAAGY